MKEIMNPLIAAIVSLEINWSGHDLNETREMRRQGYYDSMNKILYDFCKRH